MGQFVTNMTALDIAITILTGVASIVVAAWIGSLFGRKQVKDEYRRKYDVAISGFARRLSKEIVEANSQTNDQDIRTRARAIVAMRNEMKDTLTTISRLLNSEIDVLESLLSDRGVSASNIKETLAVLDRTWKDEKVTLINNQIRKLLVDLGLVES
jgi:predicted HTH domain antitoxin